jgi:hypothetical protein
MLAVHLFIFGFDIALTSTDISESSTNVDFLEVNDSSLFGDLTLPCRNYHPKGGMQELNGSKRGNG